MATWARIPTATAGTLHGPTANTKIRRSEDPKEDIAAIELNTAAGRPRLRAVERDDHPETQTPHEHMVLVFPDDRLAPDGGRGCRPASPQLDSPGFDSSILRIFASSRRPVQRDPPGLEGWLDYRRLTSPRARAARGGTGSPARQAGPSRDRTARRGPRACRAALRRLCRASGCRRP